MTFRIEDHALGDLHEVETFYAAPMLGAECACHNPDESGEGRVDFTGATLAEIAFAWLEHIDQTQVASWEQDPEHFVGLFTAGGDRVQSLGN